MYPPIKEFYLYDINHKITTRADKYRAIDYAVKNLVEGCIFITFLNGHKNVKINGMKSHLCSKIDNPGYNYGNRIRVEVINRNTNLETENNINVYCYDTDFKSPYFHLFGDDEKELSDKIHYARIIVSHDDGIESSISIEAVDVMHDLNIYDLSVACNYASIDYRSADSRKFCVHKDIFGHINLEIITHDGLKLQCVKNQTPELCLEAVKQNGHALQFVKNQTPELCLEAVKQNGNALQFVKEQTNEICLEAFKQEYYAFRFVENQTNDLCLEAIKMDAMMITHVNQQTPELCLEAVKRNGLMLVYVNDPTPEICEEAIKQNPKVLEYIESPTLEMCVLAYNYGGQNALKNVIFDNFTLDDILNHNDIKLISNGLMNIIIYKDILSGEYNCLHKKDDILETIIPHITIKYNASIKCTNVAIITNDKNQNVESLLITPITELIDYSFCVVQNQKGNIFELYKKYSELVETGYIISCKVPQIKIIKLGEYIIPTTL